MMECDKTSHKKKRVPFGRKILATTRELPISRGMKSYQADIKAY